MTDIGRTGWALAASRPDHQRTLPPTMATPAAMQQRSQLWPQVGIDLQRLQPRVALGRRAIQRLVGKWDSHSISPQAARTSVTSGT